MEVAYNLGDSDSDDENKPTSPLSSPKGKNIKNGITQIEEIQKLKEKTSELLDPKWKETRNQQLLKKMLALDEPTITPKMVDFLLQEGVIETLLGFVTQMNAGPRPTSASPASEALILSYKTTVLLTAEVPGNELMSVLGRKVAQITKASFDIFRPESAGSFYHAYRLIDCLLRCYPAEFYDAMISDGHMTERMASLLHYIGYAPVPDIFVCIITLAPIARSNSLFTMASRTRWAYFEALAEWNMMLRIAEVVVRPKEFCYLKDGVSLEEHSSCAAQLLQELSEKLSLEDTGEILLQPLGHTPEILDYLVFTGVNPNIVEPIRRASLKLLCFLLKRSADAELLCMVSTPGREQPVPMCVPNRMHHLRSLMVDHLAAIVGEVFRILINYDSTNGILDVESHNAKGPQPTRHIGYLVCKPFTTMRLLLIEFAVCMVEASDTIALSIPTEFWTTMMVWILRYAYNNIFHAYFYRLLFAILRQDREEVLQTMFVKARLLTFLLEVHSDYPAKESDLLPKVADQELRCKDICRGLVINCLNAIRLQALSVAPDSFLRQFLEHHAQWEEFLDRLEEATEFQREVGFGLRMLDGNGNRIDVGGASVSSGLFGGFGGGASDADGIDLGSKYASSLGFGNEIAWPDSASNSNSSRKNRSRNKKDLKKKRSSLSAGSASIATPTKARTSSESSVSSEISSMSSGTAEGDSTSEHLSLFEDPNATVPTIHAALGEVLKSTHNMGGGSEAIAAAARDAASGGKAPPTKREVGAPPPCAQDEAKASVASISSAMASVAVSEPSGHEFIPSPPLPSPPASAIISPFAGSDSEPPRAPDAADEAGAGNGAGDAAAEGSGDTSTGDAAAAPADADVDTDAAAGADDSEGPAAASQAVEADESS